MNPNPGLDRAIGPWALGANAVNLTVGAGIFALPAVVAAILGPAALLAYLICGALILLVLTCFAEVGSQVTRSGGVVAYVEEAFGPMAGFVAWAVFAIGFSMAADAAIAHVLLDAVAAGVPVLARPLPRAAGLLVLFAGLAAVNVRGVRHGTRVSVITTVAKLVPLLLLVAFGALAIRWSNLTWTGWPPASELGSAALVLFFAFAGAESALTPSGEIRDPGRTVPRGMLGAMAAIVLLYVALQLTAQGVLGTELASGGNTPLLAVAQSLAGGAGRAVIAVCTAVAVFGALAADMIGTPRAFLAAAEGGTLPAALRGIHPRFHTPWVSIVAFAGLTFLTAVSGSFRSLAVLGSLALLLVYLAVCLAALRIRYTRPQAPGTFRAPGGPTVALLASGAVVWVLAHSTRRESVAMAVFIGVAALYYIVRMRLLPPALATVPSRVPTDVPASFMKGDL